MRRALFPWIICFVAAVPAASQESPTGPLAAEIDRADDAAIASSLEERFARIESLAGLSVEVGAGVVRLTGEVARAGDEQTALSIARRTRGVAEVVDRIEVTRDVEKRLRPAFEKLEQSLQEFVAYLPLLAVAALLVVFFVYLGRWVSRRERLFRRISNPFVQNLARQAVRLAVLVVGLLLALEVLDATALVGAVLGTAGVVGLAIGFAFRDLVENYIASVLLSLRQPFAPNDFIQIGPHQGKVLRLTSRATVLMTLDGNHLRIPNADVFKGVILNYTRNPLRRFDFQIGVGFGADLAAAQRLGLEVVEKIPGVVEEPAPMALLESLGDSSVLLRFYGWIDQRDSSLGKVQGEAIRLVKGAFEDAGIDVPEPAYRLRLEGEAVQEPPRRPAARAPGPRTVQGDLSADDAVDRQIAAERIETGDKDLLDENAPRE